MNQIVDLLHRHGNVRVKELSTRLLASEMTVRRDLDELEEEGVIRRTYGGAVLVHSHTYTDQNNYLIGKEITKNIHLKSAIGRAAAALVNPGETVGFDIGTTIPFIARCLDRDIKISALCVTFECALELYSKQNVNLIMPGGHLHRNSDVFNSHEGIALLKKIRNDKLFVSAGGIEESLGITCYHEFHVVIKKTMMSSSKKIILVADSSKFGVIKPAYFADLSDVHALVTDDGIPDRYVSLCRETGTELIVAKLR